jgi:hypothetical protein
MTRLQNDDDDCVVAMLRLAGAPVVSEVSRTAAGRTRAGGGGEPAGEVDAAGSTRRGFRICWARYQSLAGSVAM